MSGSNTRKWTPDQRRAVERAVIDDNLKVPAVAEKAAAGELRPDISAEVLEPFAMPIGTIRRVVDVERKRRRELAVQAAAISDPDTYSRDMILLLMAECRAELQSMHSWLHSGRKTPRRAAWDDITAAAKAIESLSRASTTVHKPAKDNGRSNASEPEAAPSLVSTLAKQRPSRTAATAQRQEPGTEPPTHVSRSAQDDGAGSPIPPYALAE